MTRIISGKFGGRRIDVPKANTRPTSDRVREALFASLNSRLGSFAELHVLDLYAGSGALGIESLSRGAAGAEFVDAASAAVRVIKKNLAELGIDAKVHQRKASAYCAQGGQRFDLVFLDPPYDVKNAEIIEVLALLAGNDRLNEEALIVVERAKGAGFDWPAQYEQVDQREYGQTALWYGHFHG